MATKYALPHPSKISPRPPPPQPTKKEKSSDLQVHPLPLHCQQHFRDLQDEGQSSLPLVHFMLKGLDESWSLHGGQLDLVVLQCCKHILCTPAGHTCTASLYINANTSSVIPLVNMYTTVFTTTWIYSQYSRITHAASLLHVTVPVNTKTA